MFSRLFSSSKSEPTKDLKRNDDPPSNAVGVRSASPTVTEPASISTSVPPGSPTRGCAPRTPSPIPGSSVNMDSESLRALIKSCPAKTVYSYTLSQIEAASPAELSALSSFFQALTPPQQLHCVRCHKWYYEVDNNDRSCTMSHDDESAEVEHVGYGNSRGGGAYETRWDCCGRTVEGSGELGPPNGWCYEGEHTVDRKRARYRNDSTLNNDLLQSCERKGCHRERESKYVKPSSPIADDARSMRSVRSVRSVRSTRSVAATETTKKRGRKRKSQAEVDDEEEKASVVTRTDIASVKDLERPSPPKRKRRKTVSVKAT